jgi:hypothetical protein
MKRFFFFFAIGFVFLLLSEDLTSQTLNQGVWRWRNDDGSQTTATWKAAENTTFNLTSTSEIFRLRVEIYRTSGSGSEKFVLFYRQGTSGSFTRIRTTDGGRPFVTENSSNLSNCSLTTRQLTLRGGYTFTGGRIVENNSNCPNCSTSFSSSNNTTEWEWVLKATSSIVSGATYQFRVYEEDDDCDDFDELNFYESTITMTYNPVAPPTISTTAITNITKNTASSGGNTISDGGASITARGVVWHTSASPTTTTNTGITSDGTGTTNFSSSITALNTATVYHVRAYATNSEGTSYGDNLSFKTRPDQATNVSITGITTNSFDVSWVNGNGDGRAIFVKALPASSAEPVDNTTYTANLSFGNGTQIGATGWYCVYNSTSSGTGPITITNVTPFTQDYKVMVCEYVEHNTTRLFNTDIDVNNPRVTASTVYLSNDYDEETEGWMVTHFNSWDDVLTSFPSGGPTVVVSNYVYPDDMDDAPAVLDIQGFYVEIGAQDFTVFGSIIGGLIQTPSTGKLIMNPNQTAGQSQFPITDGENDFSVIVIADDEEAVIEVKYNPNSATNNSITDLWTITGPTGLNATIILRIDKAAIAPQTLDETIVIRYFDTDEQRYVPIPSANITVQDMGTYYLITITNVNKFN